MAAPRTDRFARVVIDVPLPQPLDYRLVKCEGSAGQMCVVPVGRRSRMGLVVDIADETAIDPLRLKDVVAVIDQVTPLDRHWLDFTQFASDYYQHPWGEVALPALPPILRTLPGPRFTQALARLRKREIACPSAATSRHRLTAQQQAAVEALLTAQGFGVHLLFGITGSGKTEVYLRAIEDRLQRDERAQVLMLVPEINLTPQLESLLRARFGAVGVVVLHSGLPDGERSAAWLAAHEGRARIVVGTRLAVFASMPGLALIVVDEEHDPSYKAGEGVRYSARDLAIKRAQMLGVPAVLGSATPSLETWAAAQGGRYTLLRLTQRAVDEDAEPPSIEIVDLRSPGAATGAGISLTSSFPGTLPQSSARA